MSEDYRQSLREQLVQQYKVLEQTQQKINTATSPLEQANAEREEKQLRGNIERIEQELSGSVAAPPTQFFRYSGLNSAEAETELIGRETELKELDQMLSGGGCAAIIGVGGQGKTALAYAYLKPFISSQSSVVSSQSAENPQSSILIPPSFERAVWVRVQGDGTDLNKLLDLVGLKAATQPGDSAENLRQYLAAHPVLVVLDNFEDAIKAEGSLALDMAELVPRLGNLRGPSRVIITSREVPKGIAPKKWRRLEGLSQQAGAELLGELGLDGEPPDQREEASHRVAGNPFFLTLLAGLVTDNNFTGMTLEKLLRDGGLWDKTLAMEERLLLRTWNTRLNAEERRLLQWTAILRPPVRYESLRDLFQPADEMQFDGLLNGLGAKALFSLERDSTDPATIRGYDLHPLFRHYILTHQLSPDNQSALHQSAAAYFQSLIPTLPHKENYGRKKVEDVWYVLEAIHHLNEQGEYEAAIELFFAEDLHKDLSRLGQAVLQVEIYSNWAKVTTWRSSSTKGVILGNLGSAYSDLGKIEEAIVYYQQALVISREIGNKRNESRILGNLGNAYAALGKIEEAIIYYQQALEISKEVGDKGGEGIHLGNLSSAYSHLGKVEQAILYYEQALVISREIGNRRNEGAILGNLGNAYSDLGKLEQAIIYYQQALAIAREIGYKRNEGNHLGNLGLAYKDLEQMEEANKHFEQALAIAREIGDKRNESNHLGNIGIIYHNFGKLEQAIHCYQQALAISREIGDRRNECTWLGNLSESYLELGQLKEAMEYLQKALSISREIGYKHNVGYHLKNFGCIYEKQNELPKALANWRYSFDILTESKYAIAKEPQELINKLRERLGEEEFARLWTESEPIYEGLRTEGKSADEAASYNSGPNLWDIALPMDFY